MNKAEYEKTRVIRKVTAAALIRKTKAPRTVLAWLREIDTLERRHNSCAWPAHVPIDRQAEFLENCTWDLEMWAAEDIIDEFGFNPDVD